MVNRTLVVGDIHLTEKPPGLLDAQVRCIQSLIAGSVCETVIFLGDMTTSRKPTPKVLLALSDIFDFVDKKRKKAIVLRGNHDSNSKSDDGITALSVFESDTIRIVTQTWADHENKRYFIPHYEDITRLREHLSKCPSGYLIFGHFGYAGAYNSMGNVDSDIQLSEFPESAILGHIHAFRTNIIEAGEDEKVITLGTPYSTNFGEQGQTHYTMILSGNDVEEIRQVDKGPRHIKLPLKQVEDNLEELNNPKYFTMLRVILDPGESPQDIPGKLSVAWLNFQYNPMFNEDDQSVYMPDSDLMTINDATVREYVEASETTIPVEKIMEGYHFIKRGDEITDEN